MEKTSESIHSRAKDFIKFQFKKDNRLKYKLAFFIVILIAAFFVRFHTSKAETIELKQAEASKNKSKIEKEVEEILYIDISGAVNSPGVYKIDKKTRLFELIEKAGGLKENANLDAINQAEFVEDAQKIIIPSKSEDVDSQNQISEDSNSDSANGLININNADKSKLTELPGVGDAIAERIMEYRKKNRFYKPEDLKNVKGIGDATFDKLKSLITV